MTLYKHRILPGHQGGTYDPSNVVLLTMEEHAEAHKELWEKYGNKKDYIAYKALSGQMSKEEARIEAVKAALTGKKQTPEQVRKRVEARMKTCPHPTLGKKLAPASDERKRKISEANKGVSRPRKPHSEETKRKMSEAAKNRKKSLPFTTL